MTIVLARDVTHSNLPALGNFTGLVALYDTGSGGIAASAADYAAHPGAIHIDQDAGASDTTADILDVETGAATPAEVPGWLNRARAAWKASQRRGQRWPGVYVNQSNLTSVANACNSAGVVDPVPIWLAEWNNNIPADSAQILASTGPFPLIGAQIANAGAWDTDLFSSVWLSNVAGIVAPPSPPASAWDWKSDGKESLRDLAQWHNTDVATLLWLTFNAHSQPSTLNQYVDAGNFDAILPAGITIRFPGGH
jgi:hypothetical protein